MPHLESLSLRGYRALISLSPLVAPRLQTLRVHGIAEDDFPTFLNVQAVLEDWGTKLRFPELRTLSVLSCGGLTNHSHMLQGYQTIHELEILTHYDHVIPTFPSLLSVLADAMSSPNNQSRILPHLRVLRLCHSSISQDNGIGSLLHGLPEAIEYFIVRCNMAKARKEKIKVVVDETCLEISPALRSLVERNKWVESWESLPIATWFHFNQSRPVCDSHSLSYVSSISPTSILQSASQI